MNGRTHFLIPDLQQKDGVPGDHLDWIGEYIANKKPDVIVVAGDAADMPSLSSYDRGKLGFEGRRYWKDIRAANAAFERLHKPIFREQREFNRVRRERKEKQWLPELHITLGNHENRITRAIESQAELEGALSLDHLNYADLGYKVHPYLKPVEIDGVRYAHLFCRSPNGQVMQTRRGAPNARLQVVREMVSCSAGHLQGMQWHAQPFANGIRYGLIAGSCYLHEEEYLSAQGTNYWRGIVVKRGVKEGEYAPWFVTLKWLCEQYEKMPLEQFMWKKYRVAA